MATENWVIIGSGDGLLPERHQADTWTNVDLVFVMAWHHAGNRPLPKPALTKSIMPHHCCGITGPQWVKRNCDCWKLDFFMASWQLLVQCFVRIWGNLILPQNWHIEVKIYIMFHVFVYLLSFMLWYVGDIYFIKIVVGNCIIWTPF